MTDYLQIEHETTLRAIDAALEEFHIELPTGGAVYRDHGVHLLVEQLRRAEVEVERLRVEIKARDALLWGLGVDPRRIQISDESEATE